MSRFALLCCLAGCAAVVLGAEERIGVSFETGTYSQYIWRGLTMTDGPVLQTSTTATYRHAHLNVFTNMDLGAANQRPRKISELDFDAGYDRTFERVTLSGGFIHYTFPNTLFPTTTELYWGAAVAVPLHPAVKVFADVGAIRGTYVTLDVAHTITLLKPRPNVIWSAEFSAGLGAGSPGYNRGYFGVPHAALIDVHPAIAVPLSLGPHVRVTPRVGYGLVMDESLRQSEIAKVHGFYCGISFLAAF